MSIPFNIPPATGREPAYLAQVIANRKLCGDGAFTKQCSQWLEQWSGAPKVLLTTSCTSALEMAALLCGVEAGDEVILPSFTFVSTADAFVQRGAKLVYVDIRPDTMNIDETKIEAAITSKTTCICVVHYAGVACEMDAIMDLARRHQLKVVEDAAQGVMSTYKGRPLGSIGDVGCYSFHETKNYTMGEGGAVVVNHPEQAEPAEIIREKGTNRSKFIRGQIDKYTWVDYGSSYLPSELNAAYLLPQLEEAEAINRDRLASWNRYWTGLKPLADRGSITLPTIPSGCQQNAHMFYIKCKDLAERTALIQSLKEWGITSCFHYVPLHTAPAGQRFGLFAGEDQFTTRESDRLTRLPLYYGLTPEDCEAVIRAVRAFYGEKV